MVFVEVKKKKAFPRVNARSLRVDPTGLVNYVARRPLSKADMTEDC